MIKAIALKPVSAENKDIVANILTKRSQNIKIEYSQNTNSIPNSVENLACKMIHMDADIRGLLNDLRVLYASKQEDFMLCLNSFSKEKKADIINLFQNLYGVVTGVRYCADCDVLKGKVVFSPKAQMFIMGQYMEIAVRKVINDVLVRLEKKYDKPFKIYSNTKVTTVDGILKNEFDLIIENVEDSIVYVIEIKSGKNFRDFDKLARIGKEYGIVPNRLLLVDNYLTTSQIEVIEYFCEYFCANLEQDNLEKKLIAMIENDL